MTRDEAHAALWASVLELARDPGKHPLQLRLAALQAIQTARIADALEGMADQLGDWSSEAGGLLDVRVHPG